MTTAIPLVASQAYRVYLFNQKNFRSASYPQLLNRHLWRNISKAVHLGGERIELIVAKIQAR